MITLKQQLAEALDGAIDAARRNNFDTVYQYRAIADHLAALIRQRKAA
jgi:hypothetical protein